MKKKKIVAAMSGGVDSSVAAALLKEAGVDVIGVFMKFWMAPEKNGLTGVWNRCCSPGAEVRARKVAKILKIPFYVFNFEKEFKKRIVDYFLDGYKKEITPNPCVVCNKEIKFGLLLEKALSLDVDYIATGHYARIESRKWKEGSRKLEQLPSTYYSLLTSKDKNKDQSYFLWMLNQKQLKRTLFPIGDYTREEVKNLAKNFGLSFLLTVPKSVEICFIPNADLRGFLKTRIHADKGRIINTDGQMIGEHGGLAFYTIGQRKRIKLPGGPYYVLDKDLKRNLLIVTKNDKDLYKKELLAKNVNWISGKEPKLPLKVKAKIRYRHAPASVIITKKRKDISYKLIFKKPQRAITPGQSVVFYTERELLGGGIICPK